MTSELAWKFIALLVPIAGSVIQVWATLLKRSNWIRRAQVSVSGMGWPFFLLDRLPLLLAYVLLLSIFCGSILGLMGGGLIVTAPAREPPPFLISLVEYSKQVFDYAFWLMLAYLFLAVLIYINALPKLLLAASYLLTPFWQGLTFHPGWINASRHAMREDEAVPINTNTRTCRSVANDIIDAWANAGQTAYEQHRATKPAGFSSDELANFLLVANAIESAIHDLKISRQVQFGALYDEMGRVGSSLFAPTTLRECSQPGQSLYGKLREKVPSLPDQPLIHETVTKLVRRLVSRYSGRAFQLAKGFLPIGYDAGLLERRLRRLPGFANSQAMRAQVVKLGVEMEVWYGMDPGPFIYPFTLRIARFLLNLDCLRTQADVKTLPCDDDFIRLTAWTMDRIVDAAEGLLTTTADARLKQFCQSAFNAEPREVPRWALCRELDYFLWVQTRDNNTEGGIFGERATKPWKIEGNSFTKS
ncbi:MAG TPA: hypothetical protein VH592_22060 [Gemmataceae bacterium]|jgi:hypothetical protein